MAENDIATEIANLESSARYVPEVWDEESPQSMLNCLDTRTKRLITETRESEPELFELDEHELFEVLERRRKVPTPTLNRLRGQLWMEFERSRSREQLMDMNIVCAGVCSTRALTRILKDPSKAAWLFSVPERYLDMVDETLEFGMKKMRAILAMDPVKKNGTLDSRLMELQFKITAMMDLRKNGAPTQKIEQKSMNMNFTRVEKELSGVTLEELEQRVKQLQKDNLAAQNLPAAVIERLSPPPAPSTYESSTYDSTPHEPETPLNELREPEVLPPEDYEAGSGE